MSQPRAEKHSRRPRRQPALLPTRVFARHLARASVLFAALITGSLAIGAVGYHVTGELPWIDSLLNASMILTGMGPVDRMVTTSGKLFASTYALFSGVVFLSSIGVLLAPILHRVLHGLHIEAEEHDATIEG